MERMEVIGMTFQNEKEVDNYINSLTKDQLKKIVKKNLMHCISKEKPLICKEGTFGNFLEKHCDSPTYSSIGIEIYSNKDKELKFYYDYNVHKTFSDVAKIFSEYINYEIKAIEKVENGKMFWLNSGAGSVYKVLLDMN